MLPMFSRSDGSICCNYDVTTIYDSAACTCIHPSQQSFTISKINSNITIFCSYFIFYPPRLSSPVSGFAKGVHEHRFTNRGLYPKRLSCRSEVFLGGSCNPTTWRKEVAIPLLKKHSITFFNPVNQLPSTVDSAWTM